MHCTTLADLAAIVSQNGPSMTARADWLPASRLTNYWVAFRSRLDLWHQAMSRNRIAHEHGDWMGLQDWWNDHMGVLEEILVTDMLTRIIAALSSAVDDETAQRTETAAEDDGPPAGVTDRSAITHAIHLNHLEARNRVQLLMVNNRGCRVSDAVRLNRLRRLTERWTDTWLGRLSIRHPNVMRYAFDAQRATENAIDFRESDHETINNAAKNPCRIADSLLRACMRDALTRQTQTMPSLPAANAGVAHAVLGMMPSGLFDDWGIPKSLERCRIESDCAAADRVPVKIGDTLLPGLALKPDGGCDVAGDASKTESQNAFQRWYLA